MPNRTNGLEGKERALREALNECGSVVIAFSGGVDSAYLCKAALDALGPERVLAVTGNSSSYPEVQRRAALEVVDTIGLPHLEIDTHELSDPRYAVNDRRRCYYCKSELYGRLVEVARERGYRVVLDGSNADDLDDHRPGLRAARELGVRSPLQEAGLTKDEIRALSRRAGLPTWSAPASPCLASRIAYGIRVTPARLSRIERAEAGLAELYGWRGLRVRLHGELARLEVAPGDLPRLADPDLRRRVARAVRDAGFQHAALDLEGYRRGALNETGGGETSGSPPNLGERFEIRAGGADGEVAILQVVDEDVPGLLTEGRTAASAFARGQGYRYVTMALF